jgi:hypothetical protein
MRALLACLLVGCVTHPDVVFDARPKAAGHMRLVQANVGNVAVTCGPYLYKLCYAETEELIRERLAKLDGDVIALQEVSPPWQCDNIQEGSDRRVCHRSHVDGQPTQVRRLVGEGYTIACDDRYQYDCVAVHPRFGTIENCTPGGMCTRPSPAVKAGCDDGFTVTGFRVLPKAGAPFTIVNAHPQSGPSAASAGCRRHQIDQVFGVLAGPARTLATGDFNLDAYSDQDESAVAFRAVVGEGKRFQFHSGIAEHQPPYVTATYVNGGHVYDHVVSDFARGTCTTLGPAPGTGRLDGGSGTDHRALLCDLAIE